MAFSPESGRPAPAAVRVLIVDDSAYMRFTISKYLGEAPGFAVVATARDGVEALDLIPRHNPDVVTLDVEMPRLDGLSTLREIMARFPRPVVMLSSLTGEGTRETIQALTLGAVDFVAKPTAKANVGAVMDEVIAKVRAAAGARVSAGGRPPADLAAASVRPEGAPPAAKPRRSLRPQDRVVVIGSSTGGPRALQTVMERYSASLPTAVLIVQHMPVGFTHSLAERLDGISPVRVKEAEPGDVLQVGQALLAPGGFHMTIEEGGTIALNQNPTVHGVRPAIDVTMASVAQRYQASAVGVVLTGMGHDGTHGSTLIHAAGGKVIAEDESTCVVWGMPRSVAEAGVADAIVPLQEVPQAIARLVGA